MQLRPLPERLRCAKCHERKPPYEFPRNRSKQSGFHSYCKLCHRQQFRESLSRRHGGSTRHYHLNQKYGISAAQANSLIEKQGGTCAVCRVRPATQVDHCHQTGIIRGMVCLHCNAAMGAFHDDSALIRRAMAYVQRRANEH